MSSTEALAAAAGITFFDWQTEALAAWDLQRESAQPRLCLYFRTGGGKTITSLALMAQRGVHEVLVIAPPITHPAWVTQGRKQGVEVTAISHAMFRKPGFLVKRSMAVIADEFHLFGGSGGQGWKKLDRLARALKQPMIIMSATPNYNDIERCYCVEHILHPHRIKGGLLDYIYQHCTTEQNHFGLTPIVTGFHRFKDAEDYLSSLDGVVYLPDTSTTQIVDVVIPGSLPIHFEEYGLNRRKGRIMSSMMEERHARYTHLLVDDDGILNAKVWEKLIDIVDDGNGPTLLFCNSSKIAEVVEETLSANGYPVELITGQTSAREKALSLKLFKRGSIDVLVGTATLATGTDGLDKVCDKLVIVNDTDDDALRRQLIGRILPRGEDDDASMKKVWRFVVTS